MTSCEFWGLNHFVFTIRISDGGVLDLLIYIPNKASLSHTSPKNSACGCCMMIDYCRESLFTQFNYGLFFSPGESLWKYYLFSPPHNVTKDLLYGFIYSNKYLPHLNHKTLKIQWNRALNITDDVIVLSIIPETVLGSLRGLWIVLESLFWDRFLF